MELFSHLAGTLGDLQSMFVREHSLPGGRCLAMLIPTCLRVLGQQLNLCVMARKKLIRSQMLGLSICLCFPEPELRDHALGGSIQESGVCSELPLCFQ